MREWPVFFVNGSSFFRKQNIFFFSKLWRKLEQSFQLSRSRGSAARSQREEPGKMPKKKSCSCDLSNTYSISSEDISLGNARKIDTLKFTCKLRNLPWHVLAQNFTCVAVSTSNQWGWLASLFPTYINQSESGILLVPLSDWLIQVGNNEAEHLLWGYMYAETESLPAIIAKKEDRF